MTRAYLVDKEGKCPHCGTKLDAASAADPEEDRAPEPGDVSVCIKCAGIVVFVDRFSFRAPTPEEEKEALANPLVANVREAVKQVRDGD